MTDDQIKEQRLELLKDPGWRALLTIFCGILLRRNELVWKHVDLEARSIDIEKLLDDAGVLSGGEKRMVNIALSLFSHGCEVNLYRVLSNLDEENAQLVIDAIGTFLFPDVTMFRGNETAIQKVLVEKPVRKRT